MDVKHTHTQRHTFNVNLCRFKCNNLEKKIKGDEKIKSVLDKGKKFHRVIQLTLQKSESFNKRKKLLICGIA